MTKEKAMKSLFSSRLQYLLEINRMKQNDLSNVLGVSESTVGKWILKKAIPRMGMIQKMSEYFGVSIKYFLEEDCNDAPLKKSITLDNHEEELIKKYRQLPQAGKAAVDTMLNVQYDLVKPKLSVDTETS